MNTKDAATIAPARNCGNQTQQSTNATSDTTGSVAIPVYSDQDVEDARRYLTLAALRWQARLDAHRGEAS